MEATHAGVDHVVNYELPLNAEDSALDLLQPHKHAPSAYSSIRTTLTALVELAESGQPGVSNLVS